MNSKNQYTHPPVLPSVLVISAVATWLLGAWLLISGSMQGHPAMLAWGVVTATFGVGLVCVLMIRALIDDAVRRCVDATNGSVKGHVDTAVKRTAVKVGAAIASGLREGEHQDHPDVPRIYSGRN